MELLFIVIASYFRNEQTCVRSYILFGPAAKSPKFKRESLNETSEFPLWVLTFV